MIGSLRGLLAGKQAPQIIIECGGVGYEVETPMSTFLELPAIGKDIFLRTHLLVREDAQTLYGFSSEDERWMFRSLLKISGVGAKLALAILSAMSVKDFARCVSHEDAAMLVKIPGVGKKTAERLIIEMRDRVKDVVASSPAQVRLGGEADPRGEAFDALVALGYKPIEVKRLLSGSEKDDISAEDLIRRALKQAVN